MRGVELEDVPLAPFRVDMRHVSDSILTEILGAIARSLLVLVDISTTDYVDSRPIRNSNVMYELGLAQATRLPEEVLIFRSDRDRLPFDTAHVRVNSYNPEDEPEAAITVVREAIVDALREIDLAASLAVQATAKALDYDCWSLLLAAGSEGLAIPRVKTMGDAMVSVSKCSAISRLLELGALEINYPSSVDRAMDDDAIRSAARYAVTPFGQAIIKHSVGSIAILD